MTNEKKFAGRGHSSRCVIPTQWLGMCMFAALVAIGFSASAFAQTLPGDACIAKCKASMAASVGSDEAAVKAADEECAKGCAGQVATTIVPAPVEEFDVTSCPTPKKGKSIDVDTSEEKGKCLLKDFEPSDCTPKKGKSVDLDASEDKQKCVFKAFEPSDCTPKKGKQLDEEKSESKGRCIYAVAPPVEEKPAEKKAETSGTMRWVWLVIGLLLILLAVAIGGWQKKASRLTILERMAEDEDRNVKAQVRRDEEERRQQVVNEARIRQEAADNQRRERQERDWRPPAPAVRDLRDTRGGGDPPRITLDEDEPPVR